MRRVGVLVGVLVLWVLMASPAMGAPESTAGIERDLDFRAEFGLPADVRTVRDIASRESVDPDWGVALTAGERANLADRLRVKEELPALVAALEAESGFGGLFIDQRAGGVVDIAATADASARIQELVARLAPTGASVRVRGVENSLASLKALKLQLRDHMISKADGGEPITSARVDLRTNRVVIGVDPIGYEASVARLAKTYAGKPVDFEEQAQFQSAACTRQNCNPLRGGLAIAVPRGTCTSGFIANVGAQYYLVSAGHCMQPAGQQGQIGGDVFHPAGVKLGDVNKNSYKDPTFADAASVPIAAAKKSNLVYVTSTTQRPITSVLCFNCDNTGDAVCGSGINTGFFCGTITDDDIDGESTDGVTLLSQRKSSVDVRLGDSGGPMFYGNKAMGITVLVSGAPVNGVYPNQLYSQIRDVEIQLGVSIYKG